ncbi:hypothetical protein BC829DRAFT_494332 [Chytridium lagenaria]|nr:hypothetical protein BC829DRAFT_494332 [Chytridium lagenaria]
MTQTMFSTPDYNLNPCMIDREQCSWLLPLISANSQRLTLLASRLRLGERLQREAMAASQSLLLSKLPDRVICHILSHLDNYEDIANASNINHRFREAASTTEAKIAWMLNQPDALVGWARRKITTRPDHVAAWVERVSKTSAARSRQSSSGSWPNLKPSVRRRSGSDGWILGNENEDDHELVVKVGVVDSILGRRPEVCVAMFEVLLSGILEASENLPSTVPKQDAKVGSYASDIELNQKTFCMRIKKEGCIDVYKAIWSTLCKGLQVGPILKQIVQDDSAAVTHTLSADPSGAVTPRPIAGFSDRKKHPILSSALDESSWREAVYMGITIHEESPMLLRCLISRFSMKPSTEPTFDSTTPDIKKFAKDAPVLAGQLGRLGALKEMVEGLSWDLDDDESDRTSGKGGGCDVLKAAASAGHWPVVLYVVGQTGFSEHHEGLVYTYRGLYILCQCGEHRTFDAVMTVLDGWRADEANSHEDLMGTVRKSSSDQIDANIPNTRLFSMRWRVAMEMACEKGLSDLVTFLCEQRKGNREIETLIPTTRMFALALCNGHHHTANVVLCLRAADDLSKTPTSNTLNQVTSKPCQSNAIDARNSILETTWDHKDILSGGVCQYQEWTKLAIRYCVIAAEDLAPQLGLDVPATSSRTQRNLQNDPPSLQASFDMISMEAWRATTKSIVQ